jgi:hypothetical protein
MVRPRTRWPTQNKQTRGNTARDLHGKMNTGLFSIYTAVTGDHRSHTWVPILLLVAIPVTVDWLLYHYSFLRLAD